jgi:hypothetical protein
MSFGPMYAKIREMDERLNKIETSSISQPVMSSSVSSLSSDIDSERLNNLLNECSINSTSIAQLSSELTKYTTKDELERVANSISLLSTYNSTNNDVSSQVNDYSTVIATLATKDELVPLATKDELADLLAKFDNIINIVGQLNSRIDDLTAKIPV